MNRQQRRAAARNVKKLGTFDKHFEQTLRYVRGKFEHDGNIVSAFLCVTDTEVFTFSCNWHGYDEKAAACAALRECFRRRGVKQYIHVNESWVNGAESDLRPADDPNRVECITVTGVERGGARKFAMATITRDVETVKLGPWEESENTQSWLMELLEEGHSDRAVKVETATLGRLTSDQLQLPTSQEGAEICDQLDSLIRDKMASPTTDPSTVKITDPSAVFLALESVLLGIIKDMGSPEGIGHCALFLRDSPDKFSMFSMVKFRSPSRLNLHSYKETMQRFADEKREVGLNALFGGLLNMYLRIGAQVIGALELADRIEEWAPEHQEKLRQVGLRSSFELDWEDGRAFVALAADRYPHGIIGRSVGDNDVFVTKAVTLPMPDFATAVENIKRNGPDLILGSEAKELFAKMEKAGLVRPDSTKGADPVSTMYH